MQPSPACPPRAAALLPDSSSWSPAALAGTAPVNNSSKCSPASPGHTPEMITLDTLRDIGTNREKSQDHQPRRRNSTRGKSQRCRPPAAAKHLIPQSNETNPQCPSRTHLTQTTPFLAQSWGFFCSTTLLPAPPARNHPRNTRKIPRSLCKLMDVSVQT